MSKLDRQLDEVWGEKRVEIHWPIDQQVDVDLLRLNLISEIDAHRQRVPLDLRGVEGAPEALVQLLVELQSYALSQSKVISISNALPPMQEALNPRRARKSTKPHSGTAPTAGEVAKLALKSRTHVDPASCDFAAAKKVERQINPKRQRKNRHRRDYVILTAVILAAAVVVGLVEWYVVFHWQPEATWNPSKTFE